MVFQSISLSKHGLHMAVTPFSYVSGFEFSSARPSFDYATMRPSYPPEPISVIDMDACCSSYHGLCLQDAHEVSKMLAGADTWGPLEELDDQAWIKNTPKTMAAVHSSRPGSNAHTQQRSRTRQAKCPEELARRRAHRRSLQKGYEREYRQRKRQNRDHLRKEWMCLESELKTALVAALNKTLVSSHTWSKNKKTTTKTKTKPNTQTKASSSDLETTAADLEELRVERMALQVENLVLQCALSSEEQLLAARDYFSQPELREQLNETSGTPWLFNRQFVWE